MRIPIVLALAVIILTPANIRDVAADAVAGAQSTISQWLGGDERTKVADVSTARKLAQNTVTQR